MNAVRNAAPKCLLKSELSKAYKIKIVVKDLKVYVYGKIMKGLIDLRGFFLTSFRSKNKCIALFLFLNYVNLYVATRFEM